jgi:hypothetical protein
MTRFISSILDRKEMMLHKSCRTTEAPFLIRLGGIRIRIDANGLA